VLNGEDERVAAMASLVRGRLLRFGSSPEFDVWVEEASSVWPSRLTFRLCSGGESHVVHTQLVGTHWTPAVAGAAAAATACGVGLAQAAAAATACEVGLAQAAAALGNVPPFPGRMQPAPLPGGAVMLRDDYNGHYRHRHRHIAALAQQAAELVVFVGSKSGFTAKQALRLGMPPEAVRSFPTLASAAEFLKQERVPRLALSRSFVSRRGAVVLNPASLFLGPWLRLAGRRYAELASEFGATFVVHFPKAPAATGPSSFAPRRTSSQPGPASARRCSGSRRSSATSRSTSTPSPPRAAP